LKRFLTPFLGPGRPQLVLDIIAGLDDRAEKHCEAARIRSKVLRMSDAYRVADNARQAELE
jgi:hypothetical protein